MSSRVPRRRDAEQNRQRILAVAIEVLADNPTASTDEIARAAGLARRTVYGHFATREALLAALANDARDRMLEVIHSADRDGESPAERYALFVARLWREPDRYRLLLTIGRTELGTDGVRAVMAPIAANVTRLIEAAQSDHTFDHHLPALVLAAIVQTVNFTLLDELGRGHWDGNAATATLACLIAAGMERHAADRLAHHVTTRKT